MTVVTVITLSKVEYSTTCACNSGSTSYSIAIVEVFLDVGNELATNSDCATTPSIFKI